MKSRPRSRHGGLLLHIAVGGRRLRDRAKLAAVTNRNIRWQDLIDELSTPLITKETFKQYLKLPKEEQDALKQANGFIIGGHCAGGHRATNAISERSCITLDVDNAPPWLIDQIRLGLTGISHFEFIVHSTRKHTAEKPRLRFLFPLKRRLPADRYTAAARILASKLDPTMEAIDDVSFRLAQMMYYPSHSRDSEFVFVHNSGMVLDAGAMLDAWGDWQDFTKLPYAESQGQKRPSAAKAEDPLEKDGIIGAFCRAYPIPDAIATFIPDVYVEGDQHSGKPRYTYVAGSTSNGAVVEDENRFLYSHHTSDPVSDTLVNAFDLVRIHRFGHLDPERTSEDVKPGSLPSYRKMVELATRDEAVLAEYNPHLEEAFDDEDVEGVPEAGPANGHVNGSHDFLTDDPEIAAMLGTGPPIKLTKKKKLSPLERMNKKHAIVRMGGRTLAMTFLDNGKVDFGKVSELHTYYANQPMPTARGGQEPISAWWMKQPERRTYGNGVVFSPGREAPKGAYNMWTGFAVKPDPAASCRLFLRHILEVMCSGDEDLNRYAIGYLAHMVQHPEDKPGVALVLKGQKGAGKDTIGEYVGALFPRHYVTVNRMEQLTGRFNAHQAQALLLHVEEGFWAGSKAAAGVLQNVITGTTSLIEPKGVDPFMVDSFLRVFISSNERWVVPATPGERRYAVFNVSNCHLQDRPYFAALRREMINGGLEALLRHLQTYDLTDFDVRDVPNTEGLAEQKAAGLKGADAFWHEVLEDGELNEDDPNKGQTWADGGIRVGVNRLYELYTSWLAERRHFGHGPPLSKITFGKELQQRLCKPRKEGRIGTYPNKYPCHKLPDLATCRAAFDETMGSAFPWEPIEEDLIG